MCPSLLRPALSQVVTRVSTLVKAGFNVCFYMFSLFLTHCLIPVVVRL